MNEKVKESLRLIDADIEEGMDKKFIDIDFGLELHRLIKSAETALKDYEEDNKELIAEQHRLFDLAKEQENELQKLKEQYKNIHNTKVKVPLCDILNGLSRAERERVIEDIYYSQAERQEFYNNKISKLENTLNEYKTIEQELGIDLITLFKLIKDKKFYVKSAYNIDAGEVYDSLDSYMELEYSFGFSKCESEDLNPCLFEAGYANSWVVLFQYNIDHDDFSWDMYAVKLKDYGKTWALTKEELEE